MLGVAARVTIRQHDCAQQSFTDQAMSGAIQKGLVGLIHKNWKAQESTIGVQYGAQKAGFSVLRIPLICPEEGAGKTTRIGIPSADTLLESGAMGAIPCKHAVHLAGGGRFQNSIDKLRMLSKDNAIWSRLSLNLRLPSTGRLLSTG